MTRTRLGWSLAVLLAVLTAVTGAVFILTANAINSIRGDFCSYTAAHDQATRELPQNAARLEAERSDLTLEHELGCK